MLDFLMKRPMLLAALAASVISVIALYSEVALFVLSLVILGFIFFLIYIRIKGELIFAAVLVLAVTISGFLTTVKANSLEKYDGISCFGEFIVAENPQNHGEYYSTILETVKSDVLNRGEKISVNYSKFSLEFSQKITATVSLKSFKQKSYKNSNYSQGIFLKGYIKNSEPTDKSDTVLSAVGSIRKYIKKTVFKNYKRETAATVMALVAGDKSYFSQEFYNNVKNAGVAHVMVVSGMHLSIIVTMFLYVINRFFYNRFLKAVTILFVTISVMAICGFTMSIIRAGVTYLLVALALILDRESTGENTLGFAVVGVLLFNPFAIFSVAFQLSVLSTFAILVVATPINEFVEEKEIIKSKFLMGTFSSSAISISALIFTAPITIYYFGFISAISVITNLLITTAASFIMIFCILAFIVPFLSQLFFAVSEAFTRYVNSVINYFGSLKFSTVNTPKWTIVFPIVLIIVLFSGLVACKVKRDMVKLKEIEIKRMIEGGNGEIATDFGTEFKERTKKGRKKHIHIVRK